MAFDDPNLVSFAGLVPVMALAEAATTCSEGLTIGNAGQGPFCHTRVG